MPLIARNDKITICSFGAPGERSICEKDILHIFGEGFHFGFNILFNHGKRKIGALAFLARGSVSSLSDCGHVRLETYGSKNDPEPSYSDPDTFRHFLIDPGNFKLVVFKLPENLPPQEKVQLVIAGPSVTDIFLTDFIFK